MDWILCDDDTMQYARKLTETQYQFIQGDIYNPAAGIYMAYADIISLPDYLDQDDSAGKGLGSILKSYGYGGVQHVRDKYGAAANRIMCECIFESLIQKLSGTILFTGRKSECAGFDLAVQQSGGVLGFTCGDVRKMYEGTVPLWVTPNNFGNLPDDYPIWL